jgi:hypothetical protein
MNFNGSTGIAIEISSKRTKKHNANGDHLNHHLTNTTI